MPERNAERTAFCAVPLHRHPTAPFSSALCAGRIKLCGDRRPVRLLQIRGTLEQKFCLSQSTITRRRNEAIRLLAIKVEASMEWKTELLFA